MSISTAPIITPAAGSSTERATWPSSRARLRRLAVGSSVRSALSSDMVLYRLLQAKLAANFNKTLQPQPLDARAHAGQGHHQNAKTGHDHDR